MKGENMAYDEYEEIYMPSHPLAKGNGKVTVHRLVAQETLGRPLTSAEHVHHVNGQKKDNRPENLWVFRTKADHTRFHQTGEYQLMEDGTYTSPKPIIIKNCKNCGKEFECKHPDYVYCCNECYQKHRLAVSKRPSRKDLKNMLKKYSSHKIAGMLGVNSYTVILWCKSYKIDPNIYWEIRKQLKQEKIQREKERKEQAKQRKKEFREAYVSPYKDIPIQMDRRYSHKTFKDIDDAIEYLKRNHFISQKMERDNVAFCIERVILGKRKSYLKCKWTSAEYVELHNLRNGGESNESTIP